MSTPQTPPPLVSGKDSPEGADDQLGAILSVAMAQSKEEYDRAERIENKLRNLITATGAFFAIVQGASVNLVKDVRDEQAWFAGAIGLCAILAALAFISMLHEGRPVWMLRNRRTIDGDGLKALIPFAEDGRRAVTKKLITSYSDIVAQRQGENEERAKAYDAAVPMAGGVVALLFLELVFAFAGATLA